MFIMEKKAPDWYTPEMKKGFAIKQKEQKKARHFFRAPDMFEPVKRLFRRRR